MKFIEVGISHQRQSIFWVRLHGIQGEFEFPDFVANANGVKALLRKIKSLARKYVIDKGYFYGMETNPYDLEKLYKEIARYM